MGKGQHKEKLSPNKSEKETLLICQKDKSLFRGFEESSAGKNVIKNLDEQKKINNLR